MKRGRLQIIAYRAFSLVHQYIVPSVICYLLFLNAAQNEPRLSEPVGADEFPRPGVIMSGI